MNSSLDLEEAPTFYPSEEEFDCPLRYIGSIRSSAEKYGVCKIVPPSSWKPPFAIRKNDFLFKTKIQAIHQLQERPAGCDRDTFKLDYSKFCGSNTTQVFTWPTFEDGELDLCTLYSAVRRRGGSQKVTEENKWGAVYKMLFSEKARGVEAHESALRELRRLYESFLSSYEQHHTAHESSSGVLPVDEDLSSTSNPTSTCCPFGPLGTENVGELQSVVLEEQSLEIPAAESIAWKRTKDVQSASVQKQKRNVGKRCEHCGGGSKETLIIQCGRCRKGWHTHCLSPPLRRCPVGNWYCFDCVNSEKESFGFSTGDDHTLTTFAHLADSFKKRWFGSQRLKALKPADLEAEFWEIVESSSRQVEVLYGSDIDTSKSGSGFPRKTDACPPSENKQTWLKYVKSPWNLNNIARLDGSVLKYFDDEVPGVIVPWLYVGMTFSSFCWHFEDHSLYSINYLHWGEGKQWYGVPGLSAEAFEQVMKESFPDLFEAQPDLLFQLVTMLNPRVLKNNGVPVYSCLQTQGEFVITFPRSYHSGFNLGFNCAEAVNFAPPDWLPWGSSSIQRFRHYRRSAILSQEELLIVTARNASLDQGTRAWVYEELRRLVVAERHRRCSIWASGTRRSVRVAARTVVDRITKEEDACCVVCRYFLHVSALSCSCRPGASVCLEDSACLCDCPPSNKVLQYRYSLAELEALLKRVHLWPQSRVRRPRARPDNKRPREQTVIDLDSVVVSSSVQPEERVRQPDMLDEVEPPKKTINGACVSHREAAAVWAIRVKAAVLNGDSLSLETVLELVQEGEEFLWGGLDVDVSALGIRKQWAKVMHAKQWADDVAHCCGVMSAGPPPSQPVTRSHSAAKADPRGKGLPLPLAESLLSERPFPCQGSKASELEACMKGVKNLQEKLRKCLHAKPAVEFRALQTLYHEALRSPIEIPEHRVAKEALSEAQSWADSVRRILPTHKSVRNKVMADSSLLTSLMRLSIEGEKLLVKVHEHSLLATAILNIDSWKSKVELILESRPSMDDVRAALAGADGLPFVMPEKERLLSFREEGEQWEQSAVRAMASLTHTPASVSDADITDSLEKLIGEAYLLPVSVDTSFFESEVRKRRWVKEASQVLSTGPNVSALQYLAMKAESLGVTGPIVDGLLLKLNEATIAGSVEKSESLWS